MLNWEKLWEMELLNCTVCKLQKRTNCSHHQSSRKADCAERTELSSQGEQGCLSTGWGRSLCDVHDAPLPANNPSALLLTPPSRKAQLYTETHAMSGLTPGSSHLVAPIGVCQWQEQNATFASKPLTFYLCCCLHCLSGCHGDCPCTSPWRQWANIIGCQGLGRIHIVSIVGGSCGIIISTTCKVKK